MRGLKRPEEQYRADHLLSHPLRMRGLKRRRDAADRIGCRSHPLRMRGLKHGGLNDEPVEVSRILYGCVD